ncbi:hypothetical protein ACDP95_10020 [Weissella confusa]
MKELKMVFESTNPEKPNQKAILKIADVDETLTGAQVAAEMQKLASFTFVVNAHGEPRFGAPKAASFVTTEKRPVF